MFPVFRRTALRLLVDESMNSLHSIASYFTPSGSIKPLILLLYTINFASSSVKKGLNSLSRFPYQVNVVPGASKSFSRRREPSSWADTLEKLWSRVRSLSGAWVKGFGWWTSSSGKYESCSAAALDWESEVDSISMVIFGSGTGKLELCSTEFVIDGLSGYLIWCLFLQLQPFEFVKQNNNQ